MGSLRSIWGRPAGKYLQTVIKTIQIGLTVSTRHGTAPYAYDAGTSMAAPHVAGIFALLEATDPEDHYVQLINRLLSSTDPITSLSGICQTGGRADLRNALATTYWWPRNDNFAKAFTIANPSSANSITFVGNNVDATKQNGRTQSCWERRG